MLQSKFELSKVGTRVWNFPDFSFPGKRETGKATKSREFPGKFPGNPVNFLFPGIFPGKSVISREFPSREIPGTNPSQYQSIQKRSFKPDFLFARFCKNSSIEKKNTTTRFMQGCATQFSAGFTQIF